MTTSCNKFYYVKSGDLCGDIASKNGISLADLYAWNPAVGDNCKSMWANAYLCVGTVNGPPPTKTTSKPPSAATPTNGIVTPSPVQDGMTRNCNKFYYVKGGDGCGAIASAQRISLDDFYKWNPGVSVGDKCKTLWADVYVCVGVIGSSPQPSMTTSTRNPNGVATPSPVQDGIAKNCKTFHYVVSGDTCYDIAKAAGVSLNLFYSWNPGVGSTCKTLQLKTYVCTAVL